MGLLRAVAAAAEVAAAAAAAAVSAASINHLSSPSPVWVEGLLRCPRSPFSLSPPPLQSTARKTLNFRGGAERARRAHFPSRSGAGHPRRMRRSPSPSTPFPDWSFALAVAAAAAAPVFPGVRGALGVRCGVSSLRLVRFRLSPVGPGTRSGWGQADRPAVAPPLSRSISGFCLIPGRLLLPLQPPVVSRVLGKPALFGGSEGGKRGLKRVL